MKKSISYKRESEMQHKAQLWNGCQEKNMTEFAISTVWRHQNFDRYREGDFLSKTNFSNTNTETFFRDQIFQDRYRDFFSETKFSDTDTETFLTRPNFSIPIPRLFFRDQIFRYRYWDFFPRLNFLILIPRLFWRDQICRYQYRDFLSETKFSDTDTETTKKLAKVSRPGSLETETSHSER